MSAVTRLVPKRLKDAVRVLLGEASIALHPDRFSCPVCNHRDVPFHPLPAYFFRELDRYQHVYSIFQFETLNLEYYSCSRCGASDRDRLYALYFKKVLSESTESLSLLDIAPADALTRYLKSRTELRVRTADLFMNNVDDKIDITNMDTYRDEQFDMFICSHVLEHVPDDLAAMRELHRVLRKGGWGIAMVPINLGLNEIHEDPSITDQGTRWKYFGQNDHVRMYSKSGFVERLKSVGLQVEQRGASYFGDAVFAEHGIHPRSVLYVVRK
jgi:SAM-dependent methyltransferase